jgi:hypothetical protein
MKWDEYQGNDGGPVMWIKRLLETKWLGIALHKFVGIDNVGCFHTHKAWSFRFVFRGGYLEEYEDGSFNAVEPGYFGFVAPSLSHRIACLLDGPSYSLWIRGPITSKVELRGPGWQQLEKIQVDSVVST